MEQRNLITIEIEGKEFYWNVSRDEARRIFTIVNDECIIEDGEE